MGGAGADKPAAAVSHKAKRARERRAISTNLLAGVLIILGVLTAAQGYVLNDQATQLALCQQAYSNGFADALDARSQANADAQEALEAWMKTVGQVLSAPDPSGRARLTAAIADYLEKREKARKTQEANPFPEAPRDACEQLGGG